MLTDLFPQAAARFLKLPLLGDYLDGLAEWLAAPLPGRCRTYWLAMQSFSSWTPPCQDLSWRNQNPI